VSEPEFRIDESNCTIDVPEGTIYLNPGVYTVAELAKRLTRGSLRLGRFCYYEPRQAHQRGGVAPLAAFPIFVYTAGVPGHTVTMVRWWPESENPSHYAEKFTEAFAGTGSPRVYRWDEGKGFVWEVP
jgi:hypothetical protein